MSKPSRQRLTKYDKLHAYWDMAGDELIVYHPLGQQTTSDARYLLQVFNPNFEKELISRGYDITTLKFSIEPQRGNQRFTSQRTTPTTTQPVPA